VHHAGRVSGPTEEVARAGSASEAHIIAGFLESNGIEAVVSLDDAGGLEPQWQLTQGVRVLVAAEELAEGRRLVAEAESGGG
jgi:Putative prokaryotic signal transducing protein